MRQGDEILIKVQLNQYLCSYFLKKKIKNKIKNILLLFLTFYSKHCFFIK